MKNIITLSLLSFLLIGCGSTSSSSSSSDISSSTGQAGSMARFAISGDYLYTINSREMNVLDIKDASQPKKISKIHVPFDVETLFAYKDNLYVGANSGMYIYDKTTPTQPTRVAELSHAQSCDPVVVSDDIAYITLNTGFECWNNRTGVNRLEIVDVSTPDSPKFIKAVDMWEPTGLGVDGKTLFICDGDSGLKVYDINKTDNNGSVDVAIDLKETLGEINCYDVIAHNYNLVISNNENIRQFNYSSFPMEEEGQIK
ncbi:MAG TPA: hypothetical protein ENK82_08090 [Campylobacterales bacterium]|nr:hypothetical protein [Campylobacterales bacterium]HHS93293.1 hypothetical protein [Campylobacterales bacterium]